MAQHDYVIANASGATVRADINSMALAISSNNSGSSAPSTTYAYEFWIDTTNNLLKLRNAANNAWLTMPLSITADNTVDINGGTIDGTNVGASSAGTGAFTTLAASGATDLNSTVAISGTVSLDGSANELRFYEGSNYVGFEAPALAADQIWVLPTADGSASQVLTTNGSGTLSWSSAGGAWTEGSGNVYRSSGNAGLGTTTPNEAGFGAGTRVLSIQGAAADDFGVLELISPDVTSSNRIGEIRFGNLDGGSAFAANAGIRAIRDGADDASAVSIWTEPTSGSFTERFTIKSDGKIGAGISTPDYQFVVRGAAATNDNIFKIEDSAGTKMASMEQDSSGNGRWIVCDTSGNADVLIHTAGASYFNGGNVGIGCTPGQLLAVEGASPQIEFRNTASSAAYFTFVNSSATTSYNDIASIGGEIDSGSAKGKLSFRCRASDGSGSQQERMRINNTGGTVIYAKHQGDTIGNLLVTSQVGDSPSDSENCSIGVKNGGQMIQIMAWAGLGARVGTRTSGWQSNSGGNCYLTGQDATNIILTSGGSPTLANGTAISSDQRLKKNIADIADGQLAKIKALKPRTFEWKDTRRSGTQEGFIAQEVATTIPEAVEDRTSEPDPEDTSRDFSGDIKVIKHEILNARLVKAIQELAIDLEAAKARITTLEG